MQRRICHINIADFAVAVHRVADRSLGDRPLIVAPLGSPRARVYDHCEIAYQAGVRKGTPLVTAQRRIRDATVLAPDPGLYERAMRAVIGQSLSYSPYIEPGVADGHLFLDLTGTSRLLGPPRDAAWRLRKAIRQSLRLDPIWTLASNKLVAKVASRVVKPLGENLIDAGDEAAFLAPLPLGLLPGIGSEAIQRLRSFNLQRIGEATQLSRGQAVMLLGGAAGGALFDAARGWDPTPVELYGDRPPTVRQESELAEDSNDVAAIEATLHRMVERACYELRSRRLAARRIRLTIDYTDGVRASRTASHRRGTANDFNLFRLAKSALDSAWTRRLRLGRLRIVCDRLIHPTTQIELFPENERLRLREDRLLSTMDAVRDRYGEAAVRLGRSLPAGDGS